MKDKQEWKRKVYERIKTELYDGLDWNSFSEQADQFIYAYGSQGLMEGRIPPHGKYEIWLPNKLEHELILEYEKALTREGIQTNEQKKQKTNKEKIS